MSTGEDADPARGIALLLKAAEANEPGAQTNLGFAYATGTGVEQDDAKAAEWYQRAADQRLTRAALATGQIYATGRGVEKDLAKAVHYLQIAMSGRSEVALQMLGGLVASGEVAEAAVGEEQALMAISAAADTGDAKAIDWLTARAEGGEDYAYLRLAKVYLDGTVVPADPAKAADYYLKAAMAKYPEAQLQLAELYAAGNGVEQDYIEAHKWANLAAANGSETAAARRDLFANLMTPEQIAEAQTRARALLAAK